MSEDRVVAVIIGRNEGERLAACLASTASISRRVYVDSGSTDGSVAAAREAGAFVVELDLSTPFTAARARNAGVAVLLAEGPFDYVQTIDGDCALDPDWVARAAASLDAEPDVAIVCGRRRERFPEASIYNWLCDREWDTPVGEAKACGGDALIRLSAFEAVGGYREDLIAGEEPEMCFRLRAAGWRILRLDAEMTLHDAAITRFAQYWRRARRYGHALAEGALLHGASAERYNVRATVRTLAWAGLLPLAVVGAFAHPIVLATLLAYPLQIVRRLGDFAGPNRWKASAIMVAMKVPEGIGAVEFLLGKLFSRRRRLIEYK